MDSKIYVLIDYTKTWGALFGMRIAQAGNTVVYLTDEQSQGYAAAAKEPRVRFRYCAPFSLNSIAKEITQTEIYLSSIDGIIVLIEPKDIKRTIQMKQWNKLGLNLSSRENEISVNYLVVSGKDESKEGLEALYLKVCKASLSQKQVKNIKINHIFIDSEQHKMDHNSENKKENNTETCIVNTVSSLIVYLSSPHTKALRFQTFII